MYPKQFGAIYGGLAFIGLLAVLGLVYGLTHTYHLPKSVAHEADVMAVAGDQNLVAQCEANITNTVNTNNGKVQGFSRLKVVHKGDVAVVTVTLKSDFYSGRLQCDFSKSNWQLLHVKPA